MFTDLTLPTLPPMEVLISCSLAAVALFMLLAVCFAPFLSVACDCAAAATGRGFYTKLARQIAQMNLALALVGAASFVGCVVFLVRENPGLMDFPFRLPLLLASGCAASSVLFTLAHTFLAPQKRPSSLFHIWLGLMAGIFSMATVYLSIGLARRLLHTPPVMDPSLAPLEQLHAFFSLPWSSFFWSLAAESVPLGIAASGSCATLWLLLARGRQDYGRDYYAFAMPDCAKWAFAGTLIALPLGVLVFFQSSKLMLPELSHSPSLPLELLGILLPLLACALWIRVIRSNVPMRHKLAIFLAFILVIGGFASQVLMLNKMIPSP